MTRLPILVCLVVVLGSCSSGNARDFEFSFPSVPKDKVFKSAALDLDGDGRSERISLSIESADSDKFTLRVDTAMVEGVLPIPIEGFMIVDIDASDTRKEIAVYTPGISSDDRYLIFWYDRQTIKEVGSLQRWPTFTGKGLVYVDDWMGFWGKTDRYILNSETHTLTLTPQELYYVGVKGPVRRTFPIYRSREDVTKKDGAVVANLREKSNPLIMLWDPSSNCYLLKSESGIVGWAAHEALRQMELSYAD